MAKTKKPKGYKFGRPTIYSKEIVDEICKAIMFSNKSFNTLCKENSHWPNPDTIYSWLRDKKDFSDIFYEAKRLQAQIGIDQIIEIADDDSKDATTPQAVARAKLRIETRRWVAERMLPKMYGNQAQVDELKEKNEMLKELLSLREQLAEKSKKEF